MTECKWCHVEIEDCLEECLLCHNMESLMKRNLYVAAHMLSALFTKANYKRGSVLGKEERK